MTRRCAVTGKSVLSGNNVSHANNRTRRRFLPNLQVVSLMSNILGRLVSLRISMNGLRTIEHGGGLDNFLLNAKVTKLSPDARKVKKAIAKNAPKA